MNQFLQDWYARRDNSTFIILLILASALVVVGCSSTNFILIAILGCHSVVILSPQRRTKNPELDASLALSMTSGG
jgi:hypothetical protein